MAEKSAGWFAVVRAWLEVLSFAAVAGGIVVGFSEHFSNKAQERRDVVEYVYTALDDEYRAYLALLVQYPEAAALHRTDEGPPVESSLETRTRVEVLNELVIDLFERAYLEYNDPDNLLLIAETREDQWTGWQQDIDRNLRNPAFLTLWNEIGVGFDERFQAFMRERIARLSAG